MNMNNDKNMNMIATLEVPKKNVKNVRYLSSLRMTEKEAGMIRVRIVNVRAERLGIQFSERSHPPRVVVCGLDVGGTLDRSGLVHRGDAIVKINDTDVSQMNKTAVQHILNTLPRGSTATLLIKGPEGCVTYLRTVFTSEGTPRTVRVTAPVRDTSPDPGPILQSKSSLVTSQSTESPKQSCDPTNLKDNDDHLDGTKDDDLRIFPSPRTPNVTESKNPDKSSETNTLEKNIVNESKNTTSPSSNHSSEDKTDVKDTTPRAVGSGGCEIEEKGKGECERHKSDGNSVESEKKGNDIGVQTVPCAEGANNTTPTQRDTPAPKGQLVRRDSRLSGYEGSGGGTGSGGVPHPSERRIRRRTSSIQEQDGKAHVPLLRTRSGGRDMAACRKTVKLRNLVDDSITVDTLNHKLKDTSDGQPCMPGVCAGALLSAPPKRPPGQPRPKEEVLSQAKDFIEQYYASIKRSGTPAQAKRWSEVSKAIDKYGTYELTSAELTFGAKTAWRNAPRCLGRIQWSKLQVFDARHIKTARGMFEACCNHIKYGTNKGNIRSAITIFPPRTSDQHDFRVWNVQLIRYAGYRQEDGTVIGDAANVEFTEICQKMGWKGKGGMFDILPLLLQADGNDPEMFEIPPEICLEIDLVHPKYPEFAELGLKWYALPAVSCLSLDCGGLEFTAAPFNGWYMGSEIGSRDLCDVQRYSLCEPIAKVLGLDTSRNSSLWKDSAMLEANVSVLYSFQMAGVTITDHHSTSDSFMKHMANENRLRGGCPGDWVWLVPPISGSLTAIFHQEILNYHLRPSYEYQEDPWKTHVWKKKAKGKEKKVEPNTPRRKISFKELARAVKFSAKLMGKALARRIKCTILYATETGKSETFAKRLCDNFQHAFDAKVMCMDEYDISELEHEALVLVVTSTFGNGDPPENGTEFARALFDMIPEEKKEEHQARSYLDEEAEDNEEEKLSSPILPLDGGKGEGDGDEVVDRGDLSLAFNVGQTDAVPMTSTTKRGSFAGRKSLLRMESLGSPRNQPKEEEGSFFLGDSIDAYTGPLANVRFSVFGLGSTAYPKFCAFAHLVNRLFSELGAEEICQMGEGDELCGQEQAFQIWANRVFQSSCETFCLPDDVMLTQDMLAKNDGSWSPGKFRLTPIDGAQTLSLDEILSKLHNKNTQLCKMAGRDNLQSEDSERQTILVRLDTQGEPLSYMPGDHVGIFAANQKPIIDAILDRLQNAPPPDQLVQVEVLKERNMLFGPTKQWSSEDRFPPCTIRMALTRLLDITTPPTPVLLQQLASLATEERDAQRLRDLSKNSDLYNEWKYSAYPNLAEVLEEFSSVRVSPTLLLSQLPLLQPRFYSISSSPAMHPHEIHATVAVVNYTTEAGTVHHGVCSSWLNAIEEGEMIPCFARPAPAFRLPEDGTLPVIMVGPGTGIAPFRGFWQQRHMDKQMQAPPARGSREGWGSMTLYFGCREASKDNIYEEEKQKSVEDGVLTSHHTALSRQPGTPKTYVQDVLLKNGAEVYRQMTQEGGHFYVCGDVSMAAQVCQTLENVFARYGSMTKNQSKNAVLKLRELNRFHEDIFGVTLRTFEVQHQKRDEARKAWTLSEMGRLSVTSVNSIEGAIPPANAHTGTPN